MELHEPKATEIKFIKDASFSVEQKEGATRFLQNLFQNKNELYKRGIEDGTIVLKGGREGTLITDETNNQTYRVIGQCIGSTIYVEEIL